MLDRILAWIGGAACIGLSAALAFVIISKNAEISALQDQISNPRDGLSFRLERAQSDLTTCRANSSLLQGSIDAQGRALEVLASAGASRLSALDRILSRSSDATSAAARIMAAKPEGDACQAADQLILREVGQ